ncbi:uncharacterized protein BDZ99DRAFT_388906 [Mytilinidion resinicola]|uniref:Mediator of RNA polymerase II transcription subunit 18 n=1 Tax=Mytilinidion resinicola TaxID=574789 RepID=A0A6A6YL85_9PEZI|nr:uncharacterized protein BDZ99DRAFT_388906 [Mytilinidion resinicola]KAF2809570.1 hypothetical protein BDZ99DRAFT_388906 [Mytilinidion resinicola]
MHELLLFGLVPRARHEQVLKILAGVAAMQPQRVLERHVVYKPQREPDEPGSNIRRGASQGIVQKQAKQTAARDLYFTHMVQTLTEDDFKEQKSQAPWTHQFNDVPDTGDRGVTVRMVSGTDFVEGDPHAYMAAFGNNFVSEHYMDGHRYVHKNILILLHQVLTEPGPRSAEQSPKPSLPTFDSLTPLDPSGTYILQASIRVVDNGSPALIDLGVEELKAFKNLMKGCVELDAPDRLVLDTRVKYQARPFANLQPPAAAA